MNGRRVLITGASRGIGAESARRFAAAGYAVALNYCRSEDAALALAAELTAQGHTALPLRADVADPAQAAELVERAAEGIGGLDVLICNAGVAWQGLLTDMTDEDWRRLRGVDLDAVFYCCRSAIPHFVRQQSGKILTVSSMWGQVGASCEAAYSAMKAGVIGLTRALAKELGPSGITVNCVAPGVIDTEMNRALSPDDLEALRQEIPLGRLGTAGDVAECLLYLASPAGDYLTGQVLSPNGGMVI